MTQVSSETAVHLPVEKFVQSADGTRIGFYRFGDGPKAAPIPNT